MTSETQPDLWRQILSSASSSSRGAVLSKTIVLLGEASSGKSNLLASLSSGSPHSALQQPLETLGLSYTSFDVVEEDDLIARVGAFSLSNPTYLPLALGSGAVNDDLTLLCLSWERPWEFVDLLQKYFAGLIKQKADGDRLEHIVRTYAEPGFKDGRIVPGQAGIDLGEELGAGVLVQNPGLSTIVVCLNADLIDDLEREYKEDTIDWMIQCLRVICLRYGAALLFASSHNFSTLKTYALHRLLDSSKHLIRANVVDREVIAVPTGWDSHGKIRAAREGFDPDSIHDAWNAGTLSQAWSDRVGSPRDSQPPTKGNVIRSAPEQIFLQTQLDVLLKEQSKDPRSHFRSPPLPSSSTFSAGSPMSPNGPDLDESGRQRGGVGPLISGALGFPGVEKALLTASGRRDSDSGLAPTLSDREPTDDVTIKGAVRSPISPISPPALGVPGTPGTQNEVLANFFQSLLSARKDPTRQSQPSTPALSADRP